MSAIHVVATIPIMNDKAAEVAVAVAEMVAKVRTEPGCISYDAYESTSAPGTFVTIEQWESQEALDTHMTSPALSEAVAAISAHFDGPISIHPLRPIH